MSFIREELRRVLEDGDISDNSAIALGAALRLVEVLGEHGSPAVRAEALKTALYALAHARRYKRRPIEGSSGLGQPAS